MFDCRLRWLFLCSVMLGVNGVPAVDPLIAADVFPARDWPQQAAAELDMDAQQLEQARNYALLGGGSGCVIRSGYLVAQWGDPRALYDLKSTTKSFGATALGVAMLDKKIALDDLVSKLHPELTSTDTSDLQTRWLAKITVRHLATHTSGFEKPGGYTKLLFEPGTQWLYSDGGPNWLAECITLAYQRDLDTLLFERIFTPLGIERADLKWRNNSYRPKLIEGTARREFGSGISANVNAMARLGYLYLRQGRWKDQQLLSAEFLELATTGVASIAGLPVLDKEAHGQASDHYGLLWWNNGDGSLANVPRDAFWSWGLYDSLIIVIPSLDLVVARAGKSWPRQPGEDHYAVLAPFLDPIVQSTRPDARSKPRPSQSSGNPSAHPPSPVISGIEWAPAESIIRLAPGSDNWPITSGDDGQLYSAYGDGRGFEPFVPEKLSLGLVRIGGSPPKIQGTNLLAPSIETTGGGARGRKASGMLMLDGVLYLLARNAGNSQLAWSDDRGQSWRWADWKFTTSFGCPTFLNFGANYAGARDDYVYVYSQDSDSAYERADRMVLARVPKQSLLTQNAYEFFAGRRADGTPMWTQDIHARAAVWTDAGRCYRSNVTYNAPLKRYLWCQTGLGEDTRFEGGLTILDAPEPWGPWTVAYQTEKWDVGSGESSSIPTAWISPDGLNFHLVFSGDDFFSVRRGTLHVR